jgi:hypothetical protein
MSVNVFSLWQGQNVRNVIFSLLGKNEDIWHPKPSFAGNCGRDILNP